MHWVLVVTSEDGSLSVWGTRNIGRPFVSAEEAMQAGRIALPPETIQNGDVTAVPIQRLGS